VISDVCDVCDDGTLNAESRLIHFVLLKIFISELLSI